MQSRTVLVGICVIMAVLACAETAGTRTVSKKPEPPWLQLLKQADLISRNFSPEERADFLLDGSEAALKADPNLAKAWSLELFRIATTKLEPSHYRAAMQKNALTTLARIDPDKAAELYTLQDTPDMWNQKVLTEDYRAFGARTLFPALYAKEGAASIKKIRTIANWIGSNGEYPYSAIAGIIQKVSPRDAETGSALVSDAIRYFGTDRMFVNQYREFTEFILEIWKSIPQPLVRQAITDDLAALAREAKDDTAAHHTIEVNAGGTTVRFTEEAEYLAYRLLPVIHDLDPEWAAQVKADYGALQNLPLLSPGMPVRTTAAVVLPDQSVGSADVGSALDEHRLLQVTQLTTSDPKGAAEVGLQIRDPGLRAIALATLAPAYSRIDETAAGSWTKEATMLLDSLPPDETKLRLLTALAEARLQQGKSDAALGFFDRAFDLGEELFAQSMRTNPGQMAYAASAEEELVDLMEKFSNRRPTQAKAVSRARSTRDDLLKVKLLVAASKGIVTGKST